MQTNLLLLSPIYIVQASANCFWLIKQVACVAFSLARANAGSNIAAKMAIMAITTSNSINVKPFFIAGFVTTGSPFLSNSIDFGMVQNCLDRVAINLGQAGL